ncbi:mannose-6-phosphate isomerase isoform X4 [Syngnathoides biaculeatus]|uniref:mannose-6-phosphate isomerase isoform X4 n=1 Tax=Syngnathoides biaculeatus TaxID=300417 RepID=UPI002ADD5C31|nr:mannose-6-phosphate isomerase isoform X4 [Syngnathoides biaculeatus]
MEEVRVFPLTCAVQNYAWGKVGLDSEVAKLVLGGDPLAVIEDGKPYAEDLAARLHAEFPEHYPDNNHKPEMAIALTQFQGLCGFRPLEEILGFLKSVPEFRALVGDEAAEELRRSAGDAVRTERALKKCFTRMMNCEKKVFVDQLNMLVKRVTEEGATGEDTASSNGELLLRLHSQYPGDIGCFSVYFLNHVLLDPNQAMFLGANEPHAYLYGDCIECMACSDNTVRAGLTPKYIDVNTLCEMLDYSPAPPAAKIFSPVQDGSDPCVTVYDPPVPDFTVMRIQVPASAKQYTVAPVDSASILLVTEGDATATPAAALSDVSLRRGSVLFVSANESVPLHVASPSGVTMFRACCLL